MCSEVIKMHVKFLWHIYNSNGFCGFAKQGHVDYRIRYVPVLALTCLSVE